MPRSRTNRSNKNENASFQEQKRAAELALAGSSPDEIASILQVTKATVLSWLSRYHQSLSVEMQQRRELSEHLTYARSEKLFNIVYQRILDFDKDNLLDPRLFKLALNIMQFQRDLLSPPKTSSSLHLHMEAPTFASNSNLYDAALALYEQEAVKETPTEEPVVLLDAPAVSPFDERLKKLSAVAKEIVDEGDLDTRLHSV